MTMTTMPSLSCSMAPELMEKNCPCFARAKLSRAMSVFAINSRGCSDANTFVVLIIDVYNNNNNNTLEHRGNLYVRPSIRSS